MSDKPLGTKVRRNSILVACSWILATALWISIARAEDNQSPDTKTEDIVFIPPASGAPADRLGAGTRDVDVANASTVLLVPPRGGISASAKPLLIWYFSETVEGPVTIAITPMGGLARGFAAKLDGRFSKGFHGLNLKRSKIDLVPGRIYSWDVRHQGAGATNPALLVFRAPEALLQSARDAASAGYWYDALALLFEADFSGRLKLNDARGLGSLSQSAELDLTKILDAQE